MNELINNLLREFEFNGESVPYGFIDFKGNATTYITYLVTGTTPAMFCDDDYEYTISSIDIDVYSKTNYNALIKALKRYLKSYGLRYIADSQDFYENDTEYYHRTIEFEFEERNEL